jgi:branched-chain amino acid transport system substrate-binding protein
MDEPYPLGITDATPLVSKLLGSGAQAVFPLSYLNDSLFIVRTMRQQGIILPVIGGSAGYVIPDFEKGLGEFAPDRFLHHEVAEALAERVSQRRGEIVVCWRDREHILRSCSRRARAGNRASEIGKAESSD